MLLGRHSPPAQGPGSESPQAAPPPAPLQTVSSSRRPLPAFRAAEVAAARPCPRGSLFLGAPHPAADSALWTWALTSGFPMCLRTDILAPTDHAQAFSPRRLPLTLSFLVLQHATATSLQALLRLAGSASSANHSRAYCFSARSKASWSRLPGFPGQRGTPPAEVLCALRSAPARAWGLAREEVAAV